MFSATNSAAAADESAPIGMTMSISQIVINSLTSAFRQSLHDCAKKILDNIDHIHGLDTDARSEYLYDLMGFSEKDLEIIKPKKPIAKDKDTKEPKARVTKEVVCPLPFLPQLVKGDLCQGLKRGLFDQCTNKPKSGIYCTKCQKSADMNEGIPKCGNIETRIEQFKSSLYDYITPDGKKHSIYYLTQVKKANFTKENAEDQLTKAGVDVSTANMQNRLWYEPEKKARKVSNNLTDGMKKRQPRQDKRPQMDNDDDDGYSTSGTQYNDDERPEMEAESKYKIGEEVIYLKNDKEIQATITDVSTSAYGDTVYTISAKTKNGEMKPMMGVTDDQLKAKPIKKVEAKAKQVTETKQATPTKKVTPVPESILEPVKATKKVEDKQATTTEEPKKPKSAVKSTYRVIDYNSGKYAFLRAEYNDKSINTVKLYNLISGTEKENNIICSEDQVGEYDKESSGINIFGNEDEDDDEEQNEDDEDQDDEDAW